MESAVSRDIADTASGASADPGARGRGSAALAAAGSTRPVSTTLGGTSSATGCRRARISRPAHARSDSSESAARILNGMRSSSSRRGVISPVRMCSGASLPSKPRHVTTRSAGRPYISDSEASALRLVPRPEFCISTTGARPPNHAPAATPTAASSRTAAT